MNRYLWPTFKMPPVYKVIQITTLYVAGETQAKAEAQARESFDQHLKLIGATSVWVEPTARIDERWAFQAHFYYNRADNE
jgi:hypothetical protein